MILTKRLGGFKFENDWNSIYCLGGKRKKVQQRASKRSAIDMLTEKNNQKVEVKKEELALRRMELDFQKEKYAAEADERKTKLEMEMQERRAILSLLKDRL